MKLVFILLLILLVVFAANVQGQQKKVPRQPRRADTITAMFSMCETIRGDTVMFNCPNGYEGLKRFFQRNLRYPGYVEDTVATTLCRLWFIINKEGRVTDVGCAADAPEALAQEVMRVACKLGPFVPAYVKGKPVFTRVATRILYHDLHIENLDQLVDDHKADVTIAAGIVCRLRPRLIPQNEEDEGNND